MGHQAIHDVHGALAQLRSEAGFSPLICEAEAGRIKPTHMYAVLGTAADQPTIFLAHSAPHFASGGLTRRTKVQPGRRIRKAIRKTSQPKPMNGTRGRTALNGSLK